MTGPKERVDQFLCRHDRVWDRRARGQCIISRVCVPIAISEEDRSMLSDLDTRTKWRNIHGMLYRR
jgi:hypothetical protein